MSNITQRQKATLQLAIVSGIQTVAEFVGFTKNLNNIVPKKV